MDAIKVKVNIHNDWYKTNDEVGAVLKRKLEKNEIKEQTAIDILEAVAINTIRSCVNVEILGDDEHGDV